MKKKRIALYGKGGIGKSTVTSNLSASFGRKDYKVLQIGCDPKHDSTITLTQQSLTPILELLINSEKKIDRSDLVTEGKWGISCVEIGGPTPGTGCAGRGVIKGLQMLRKYKVLTDESDLVIFDVLGDIVCGGFFEPLRSGGADEMYIVTSGEFNACYAANNLCRGYLNNFHQYHKASLAGLIGNCRNIPNEVEILKEFAKSINLPLLAVIPRDSRIERATSGRKTIYESEQNYDLQLLFDSLRKQVEGSGESHKPSPLSHGELEDLFSKYAAP